MKTKICLAVFFSAFFTLNSFATKYMVIKVEGYVTVTYNRQITRLIRKGQTFDATITKAELQFGTNASLSFGIFGSTNKPTQIAGCADASCKNTFLIAGTSGGNRRELDEFLAGGPDLSDEIANQLHISSLQLVQNTMQTEQLQMRDGQMQRASDLRLKTTTTMPNATRMNVPAMDKPKAAGVVRQR